MIKIEDVSFDYVRRDLDNNILSVNTAIDHISLQIEQGEFVAILGRNGSGKSTLAKHLNGIFLPTEGTVYVDGIDTMDKEKIFTVRKNVGMVFQNPDNQIVHNVVEEDVGFGPENMGVSTENIWQRVEEALNKVRMWKYRKKSPNNLSGGQKQRVAIAGVLAMHPKCIVMDESTAMLDPNGRKDVLNAVKKLNKEENITVVWITHEMDEVIEADRVILIDQSKVKLEGTPREIFSEVEVLREMNLEVPIVTALAHELRKEGINMPKGILTRKEFEEALTAVSGGVRWH